MARATDRILTLHPDPAKVGTRIERARYDAVRRAILRAVPKRADGIPFKELPGRVAELLPAATRETLGSITWYTVTVKLDLEARGDLERIPGARPQRVRRPR